MRDQDNTLLDVRDAGVRAFSLAGFYPFQRCLALVTEQTLTPPAAFRGGLLVCARAGNDRRRWWEICGRGWHAFAGKGDRFTNSGSAPPDVLSQAVPAGRALTAIFPRTGKRATFTARRESGTAGGASRVALSGEITGTLITDAQGRLERLELPAKNTVVTRAE